MNHEEPQIVLPEDVEAEKLILGVTLKMSDEGAMIAELVADISSEDFLRPLHRQIWTAIRELHSRRDSIDFVTVVRTMQHKNLQPDMAYISGLIDGVPMYRKASALAKHIELIKNAASRRQMLAIGNWMTVESQGYDLEVDEMIEEAKRKINGVSILRESKDNLISASEAVSRTMVDLEKRWDSGGDAMIGLSTGIPELDRLTGGFCPGKTYVIAAGTGMGKTTLLLNMINSAIIGARTKGEECAGLMVSLEMTCPELIVKLIGIETRINTRKIKSGYLTPEEKREIMMAADGIAKHHLEFVEGFGKITPTTLSAMVERVRSKWGRIDFLAVDYIQLLDAAEKSKGGEYERITEVSRELKRLAIQYGMPVLILSQLNRKSSDRTNRDYTKSDLRGSGQIEQDADVILFLMPENWDDPDDKRRRLKIDKNRDGSPDEIVNLIFFPEHSRFVPAAHESQY